MESELGRGRADREERKSVGGRRGEEVSGGSEPGVRGFEEDRSEMDGMEECGMSVYMCV